MTRIKSPSQACHEEEVKPREFPSSYLLVEICTSVQFLQLDYKKPLEDRDCSSVSSLSQQGFCKRNSTENCVGDYFLNSPKDDI